MQETHKEPSMKSCKLLKQLIRLMRRVHFLARLGRRRLVYAGPSHLCSSFLWASASSSQTCMSFRPAMTSAENLGGGDRAFFS